MYRAIVASRVRKAWQHLVQGDYEYVLEQLAPAFTHSFAGEHALGGVRSTRELQRAWFGRLFRLLPGIDFGVEDVLVRGWPWQTRAVALIRVRATVAGRPYDNEIAQTIDLRWGRITRIHNLEHTQRLADALERLAETGLDEARAEPIHDRPHMPTAARHASPESRRPPPRARTGRSR